MAWGDVFGGLSRGLGSYAQDRARLDDRRIELEQAAADRALRQRHVTLQEQQEQRAQATQLLDRSMKLLGNADEGTEISKSMYDGLDPQARELFTKSYQLPQSVTAKQLGGFAGLPGASNTGNGALQEQDVEAEFAEPGEHYTVNPPVDQKIRVQQSRLEQQGVRDDQRHQEAMSRLQNTATYQQALVRIATERNALRKQQMQQALGLAMSRLGLQAGNLDQRRLDYNLNLAWKQALAEDNGYDFKAPPAAPPAARGPKPQAPVVSTPKNDNDALLDRLFGPAQ